MCKNIFIRFISLLLLIFVTTSCWERSSKPSIIPADQMVKILADVHIAESLGQNKTFQLQYGQLTSDSLSALVLKKHDIDILRFQQSLYFYAERPDVYQKIYDQVNDLLSQQHKSYEDNKP